MAYTVKQGDTLYGLYGADWKNLSGYTGDPKKLQIGTELPDLPGTTSAPAVPTTGQTEIDMSQAPALPTGAGDVSATGLGAATAGANTIADFQKRLDDLANQKPSTEVKEEKKSILDLVKKREDTKATQKSAEELRKDALTQAYAEMGVTPEQIQKIGGLIGEITAYNQQLADLEIKKQNAITTVEGRPGQDLAFMGGEINRVSKIYNSEISAKALMAGVKVQEMQMIQGAYADAKATATQIVNLATYDQQQAVADIEWSLNAHQDLYNLMSGEEQVAWTRQYTMAKDELARLTTEKTNVSNLMLEYPRAGITMTDTQEVATAKAQKAAATVGVGLTSSIVGGFEVLRDAAGNVVQTRVAGGGDSEVTVTDFTGKYNQSYLANRANDYINEDGSIDWLSLDDLENTDKDLWRDMTLFLQQAQQNTPDMEEAPAEPSGFFSFFTAPPSEPVTPITEEERKELAKRVLQTPSAGETLQDLKGLWDKWVAWRDKKTVKSPLLGKTPLERDEEVRKNKPPILDWLFQ